jgi:hypothetical protein
VATDTDTGQRDVGSWDAELLGRLIYTLDIQEVYGEMYVFAAASKTFYYWTSKLEWEGVCWCGGAGDGVAGPVWAAFGHDWIGLIEVGVRRSSVSR